AAGDVRPGILGHARVCGALSGEEDRGHAHRLDGDVPHLAAGVRPSTGSRRAAGGRRGADVRVRLAARGGGAVAAERTVPGGPARIPSCRREAAPEVAAPEASGTIT